FGRGQAAFRRAGLVAGERVALAARNGPTWVAIDIAALGLGLVVVPLYVDDNPENVAWGIANAEARLVLVDSARLARGLAPRMSDPAPMPRMVVLQSDEALAPGDGAVAATEFLPPQGRGDGVAPLPTHML